MTSYLFFSAMFLISIVLLNSVVVCSTYKWMCVMFAWIFLKIVLSFLDTYCTKKEVFYKDFFST